MTLDKNSLFKRKPTGTMFEFADIDGAFEETGFYDLEYSDIALLIGAVRQNYSKNKLLSNFVYYDYIEKRTQYNPLIFNTPKVDKTFVSPDYAGTGKVSEFFEKPKVYLQLNKAYPKGSEVSLIPYLSVDFDTNGNSFHYVIEYRYSLPFLQNQVQSDLLKFDLKSYNFVAFRFSTSNLFAAKALCSDLTNGDIKNAEILYAKKTLNFYKQIKATDSRTKKEFYSNIPSFILQFFDKNWLLLDLVQLLNYDRDSNFVDTSGALINILKGFKDAKYLYDFLYNDSPLVLRLYKFINTTSKREEFCQFLTALAFAYEPEKQITDYFNVKKGGNYMFDTNSTVYRDSKIRLKFGYWEKKGGDPIRFGEDAGEIYKSPIYHEEGNELFNPLALVTLEDVKTGQKVYATAISIKLLNDIEEWESIMNFIVITVNIISIFVAGGIILKGAVGLVRLIAVTDVIISSIDIALLNEKLRKKLIESGDAGKWFVENWTAISMFTSLSVMSIGFARNILRHADELKKLLHDLDEKLEKRIIELEDMANKVIKSEITTDGQNWFWKNNFGNELRWAKLKPKTILDNIELKLEAVRKGDIFEGKVGKKMVELANKYGDEVTDFSNEVKNLTTRRRAGDIDFATTKYIGEAKSNLGNSKAIKELYEQVQKYLPKNKNTHEHFLNPLEKQVVVVYDDLGNFTLSHPLLKELADDGVIFIEGINNLEKLY